MIFTVAIENKKKFVPTYTQLRYFIGPLSIKEIGIEQRIMILKFNFFHRNFLINGLTLSMAHYVYVNNTFTLLGIFNVHVYNNTTFTLMFIITLRLR